MSGRFPLQFFQEKHVTTYAQSDWCFCVTELWNDGLHSKKNKKKDPFCPVKKNKPVVVSDIFSFPHLAFPLKFKLLSTPLRNCQC